MNYNKPEVTNLGNAVAVIHGVKQMVTGLDGIQPANPRAFQAAYDLDE